MILKNCTFFNEFFEKEFGDIKIENSRIAEIGYFNEDGRDMSSKIIMPGFIDIHIHGCGGGDCCDGTRESLDKISTYLAKHGITSFCPTTMTLPIDSLIRISGNIADYAFRQTRGAKIAGINFEGPFIAKSKKGAQNGNYIIDGTCKDFDNLYASSAGLMKLITIAPEAFESDEFIKNAASQCTVSIGHTAASANECQKAISMGAKHITHLYNAMTSMTHREAGVAGTALDNENVTCELICDLQHICPAVLRSTFKILGEDRACVISDSMRAAGLGEGKFEFGGQNVYVNNNFKAAKLSDGTIAASITNLFDEFKNLINIGIDFKSALKACTINPAKVIKEDKNIGSIAVGKYADLIVTDENLNLEEVYINGTLA